MESNYVPLTEEQSGGCKFPPSCSVYITDDGNKSEVLGHGHVHQCYLQLLPKMEILYEIQLYGDQQKEIFSEEHLRFQNGTRVLYQKEEALVLGMCSLPADRKIAHDRNYWYTIEMEPATGIIHDVDQDDLIFLNMLDSNIEDAVNVATNTKENDAQLVSCNEMEASSNAIVSESAETKLNSGHDQQRDDELVDHLAREDAQKENIPILQDSSVQNSFREQEDNFESLYGHDIPVENVEKRIIHQVEISDKDSETSKEACLDDLDAKEKDNVLVCMPCSPLKRKNPSSVYIIPARRTPISVAVVPNYFPDSKKRLRTDISEVYDESDRKRRVSSDSYDEIIGKNDEVRGAHNDREWCIVNGKVLFYCNKCGTGEWANHKTSDHEWEGEKKYHISTLFYRNFSPIELRAIFEPHGKVFYCDVAEKGGHGVLTVDYDVWTWAKSVHNSVYAVPDLWRICVSSIANGAVFNHMYYDGIFKPFRKKLTVLDDDNRSIQGCIRYHVGGSCFRGCRYSEWHREVDKEKITHILRWCEANVRLSNYDRVRVRVKNPSYMSDIFREYKHRVKDLMAGNKPIPKSDYGNGAMCLYWNLQGSCCGFCSCLRDHVDQTKEKLQELLLWCKQVITVDSTRTGSILSTEQDFIRRQKNPNHMDIFLPYKKDLNKVLKYKEKYGQIPSIFDGIKTNRLCVFYYVKGSCNMPTCDFYHGTCSEDVTMQLLSWCQQVLPIKTKHQKESKVNNPDYNQELFQSFSVTFPKILAAFKEALPFSEWEKSTICYQYHVQGHCTTSCSKAQNHVKLDEDQINNIFMWCLTHSPLDTAEGLL